MRFYSSRQWPPCRAFFVVVLLFFACTASRQIVWAQAAQTASVTSGMRLNGGRYGMPAVLVGRSIYVVGGMTSKGLTGDLERIDLDKKTVETVHTSLIGRFFHTAQAQGPYIYIMGGQSDRGLTTVVERYDTRDGTVTKLAPLPVPRRAGDSAIVGNTIFLIGGTAAPKQAAGDDDGL